VCFSGQVKTQLSSASGRGETVQINVTRSLWIGTRETVAVEFVFHPAHQSIFILIRLRARFEQPVCGR